MKTDTRAHEVGFVVSAKRYLLTIEGLPSARVNDILVDANGNKAIVRALHPTHVSALALSGVAQPGDQYQFVKGAYHYCVGDYLFGRVIDALGQPVDGKGSLPPGTVPLRLEVDAPGVEVRVPIHEQLHTGVTLVDTLVPIAKGQRQLIFGPQHSGKSTFLSETVRAQAKAGTVCIYTVIGKPINGLKKITDYILSDDLSGAKTIVISALSDEPAGRIILAPSIAFLLAEYYQAQGEHVLVILDDLDSHAKYLREIALLEERLPSTQSYPGDIFYQHAHLMERSGHFTKALGGGSITALPVIQTEFKNFSDLIPTNVMACTDGHLAFLPGLRAEGIYPSISLEQSVTRVGRQSQHTLQKQITTKTQILLGMYRQQKEYAQFSSDLSEQTKEVLRQGSVLEALLQQDTSEHIPLDVQVPLLALGFTDFFVGHSEAQVLIQRPRIVEALLSHAGLQSLRETALNDDVMLDDYLHEVEAVHDLIATVCQF